MSTINFPLTTTSLFVNTLNTNKIIYLPAASTVNAGRLFYIKDICGNAARSSIYISTTGMDRIENRFQPSTLYALMNTNYGSVLMAPDGALNWYFLQHFYKSAVLALPSAGQAVATGGIITTYDSYKIHTFTTSGTFTLTSPGSITAQVLVVGGGGGGGGYYTGGGGGAGGAVFNNSFTITSGTYTVTVGTAGAGWTTSSASGTGGKGVNSTFSNITAYGGGGGGAPLNSSYNSYLDGGCGGGAGGPNASTYAGVGSQGGSGGASTGGTGCGGGGGMGGAGVACVSGQSGAGGPGATYTIGGQSYLICGGGGGGGYTGGGFAPGAGGSGIGGAGGLMDSTNGYNATYYGSGGGGSPGNFAPGGNGADGLIIIAYLTSPSATITFSPISIPGIQLWLDGNDPVATGTQPTNGSTVSTWVDKSGNGYNGTQVNSPTYDSSRKAIYFTGSSQYYTLPDSTFPTGNSSYTYFMIVNFASMGSSPNWVGVLGGGGYTNSTTIAFRTNGAGGGFYEYWYANDNYSATTYNTNTIVAIESVYVSGVSRVLIQDFNTFTTKTTDLTRNQGATNNAIGRAYSNAEYMNGYIHEVLVYNMALSTTQRQMVEGYLAHKWEIQASLPSGHPYKSVAPTGTIFSPISISGLSLWLDAADTTTLSITSGNITSWADKSGNGRTGTSTGNPTLSSGQIVFSGSQWFSGSISNTTANLTAFVVAKTTTSPATQYARILSASAGGNDFDNTPSMDVMVYLDTANTLGSFRNLVTLSTTATTPNQTFLAVTRTNATTNTFYLNGTASSTVTLSGGAIGSFGYTTYWVGSGPAGANLTGTVSEVLYYHADLTTYQRQRIEGYLAHKWGIQTSLPSSHPYKSVAPTGTIFSPISITGLSLWLDAADSTTITLATGVSQWNDKSGNAYNLTQSTAGSQPTYASNLITFANDKYLNIPVSVMNNLATWSVFFVINPNSSSNWILAKQRDYVDTYNVLSMTLNTNNGGGIQTGSTGFLYWRSMNAGTQAVSTAAINTSTIQIINLIFDGTNLYFYKNGALEKTTAGTFAIQNDTIPSTYTLGVSIYPGGQILNSGTTNFKLGEMLSYSSNLTTSNRQAVEGYLAHKWGIQPSLPSGHPYKSAAPTS